ncbi:hypothetical protein [Thermoproteus uzoniensis]|nr:hypothetical protein [Thermoproteus uzoniensis]
MSSPSARFRIRRDTAVKLTGSLSLICLIDSIHNGTAISPS